MNHHRMDKPEATKFVTMPRWRLIVMVVLSAGTYLHYLNKQQKKLHASYGRKPHLEAESLLDHFQTTMLSSPQRQKSAWLLNIWASAYSVVWYIPLIAISFISSFYPVYWGWGILGGAVFHLSSALFPYLLLMNAVQQTTLAYPLKTNWHQERRYLFYGLLLWLCFMALMYFLPEVQGNA